MQVDSHHLMNGCFAEEDGQPDVSAHTPNSYRGLISDKAALVYRGLRANYRDITGRIKDLPLHSMRCHIGFHLVKNRLLVNWADCNEFDSHRRGPESASGPHVIDEILLWHMSPKPVSGQCD